jgi:hypothetical protein
MNPRVAVLNNGARKGGAVEAWRTVAESPRLKAFWQLHYTLKAAEEGNSPERYIANLTEEGCGHGIKVSASADGSFTVLNERNGYEESYPASR